MENRMEKRIIVTIPFVAEQSIYICGRKKYLLMNYIDKLSLNFRDSWKNDSCLLKQSITFY